MEFNRKSDQPEAADERIGTTHLQKQLEAMIRRWRAVLRHLENKKEKNINRKKESDP